MIKAKEFNFVQAGIFKSVNLKNFKIKMRLQSWSHLYLRERLTVDLRIRSSNLVNSTAHALLR